MASYRSYKKVTGAQIVDGAVDANNLAAGVRDNYCVKWTWGNPCRCSAGCCCLWTVPSQVRNLNFELWGAGGNGAGACSCNRCQHFGPPGGGAYTSKSIQTTSGCTYRMCAAGVYRCLSRECNGCNGCSSFVCGAGLCVCACGGQRGCANGSWTDSCFSSMPYCVQSGCNGTSSSQDYVGYTHGGNFQGASSYMYPGGACHCWKHIGHSTGAVGLNTGSPEQNSNYCWIRCGCWIAPYGQGGQSATSNYCGRCCGQGGTGGPGLVKLTFY